jgi:hypothetical protein
VRLDIGVNALVGSADQSVTHFDLSIESPVTAGPIGVFTKQADSSWHEEFHEGFLYG